MNERYPYLRLISDADNVVAGMITLIIFVAGVVGGCRMGGVGGLIAVLATAAFAWIAYIWVRAQAEAIRAVLQIQGDLSEILAHSRDATGKRREEESA